MKSKFFTSLISGEILERLQALNIEVGSIWCCWVLIIGCPLQVCCQHKLCTSCELWFS